MTATTCCTICRALLVVVYISNEPIALPSFHNSAVVAEGRASSRSRVRIYYAFGDSTGVGVGGGSGGGYPERLLRDLRINHEDWRLVNRSSLGETTRNLLRRLDHHGVVLRASLITVSVGINDVFQGTSEDEFAENYARILKRLLPLRCVLVITNLPDISFAPSTPDSTRANLRARTLRFNGHLEAIARRYRIPFVDLFSQSGNVESRREFFSSDGFHPSGAGYEFWAKVMWPKVREVTERPSVRCRGSYRFVSDRAKTRVLRSSLI